jgi:hypothetical protein
MRAIHETCGRLIAEAAGGDPDLSALLAAITANESRGCRQTFRFAPERYRKLMELLRGDAAEVDGVSRRQLQERLSGLHSEAEQDGLLKRLAGLHGYTQIAGYYSILWKAPVEALMEKQRHFRFAVLLVERFSREFHLDPAAHPAEIGRCWNAGHPNARTRSALYCWRLQDRMKIYREIVHH